MKIIAQEEFSQLCKHSKKNHVLVIPYSVDLRNSTLSELPKLLEIHGFLDLSGCTSLKHLPEQLKVNGWFDLVGCQNICKLPEVLELGDDFYLPEDLLLQLPKTLKVHGDATFASSELTDDYLPEVLEIGDSLWIPECTKLTTLPKHVKIGTELIASEKSQVQLIASAVHYGISPEHIRFISTMNDCGIATPPEIEVIFELSDLIQRMSEMEFANFRNSITKPKLMRAHI